MIGEHGLLVVNDVIEELVLCLHTIMNKGELKSGSYAKQRILSPITYQVTTTSAVVLTEDYIQSLNLFLWHWIRICT